MEILFRGKNTKGKWVIGSLVTTTRYIKHKPKQHTKHWIISSSFGNGGWFNVIQRSYVLADTIEELFGYDINGNRVWKKRNVDTSTHKRYK